MEEIIKFVFQDTYLGLVAVLAGILWINNRQHNASMKTVTDTMQNAQSATAEQDKAQVGLVSNLLDLFGKQSAYIEANTRRLELVHGDARAAQASIEKTRDDLHAQTDIIKRVSPDITRALAETEANLATLTTGHKEAILKAIQEARGDLRAVSTTLDGVQAAVDRLPNGAAVVVPVGTSDSQTKVAEGAVGVRSE